MLNTLILTGRLVQDPELRETDSGKKVTNVTLAIPRSYKNANGEYDTDFIDCSIWNGIAKATTEYAKKGDIITVKGRLQTRMREKANGNKEFSMEVIAEKVTFLPSRQHHKSNDDLER